MAGSFKGTGKILHLKLPGIDEQLPTFQHVVGLEFELPTTWVIIHHCHLFGAKLITC